MTVLRVDGAGLVALALLVGTSVVELAGAADWVAFAGPWEGERVGGGEMGPPVWLTPVGDVELSVAVADV